MPAFCDREAILERPSLRLLAPMVKATSFPLRAQALAHGADLVFGEEVFDDLILGCTRVKEGDFVSYLKDKKLIYSTNPQTEGGKNIFQMATHSASSCLQATNHVLADVAGLDLNMGCPKSFSMKVGNGAALLEKPEIVSDILKTLRRNLPANFWVSCKIRLLGAKDNPTDLLKRTEEFIRGLKEGGADLVTVHCRQVYQHRPERFPASWTLFQELYANCHKIVPLVGNGDLLNPQAIASFSRKTGCSRVMIARGAQFAIEEVFRPEAESLKRKNLVTRAEVLREYLKLAMKTPHFSVQLAKWNLLEGLRRTYEPFDLNQTVVDVRHRLNQCQNYSELMELISTL